MEMLATSASLTNARRIVAVPVTEADIDTLSQRNFLEHIPLSNIINLVPFALIGLCSLYLPDWRLMAALLALNAGSVFAMYLISRRIRHASAPQTPQLWRIYDVFAFVSGLLWASLMLPVVATLGRDIVSMFVCVVIIVSVAVTSMVVATQWRTFLCFLAGVMLCLLPQTIIYLDVIGPVPLAATIGLVPSLLGLANAVRKQNRLMIRTQLEKQQLADDLAHALAAAEYLANRDSLTGLYNRRAFEEVAGRMRGDVSASPLSLIIVDLDHFKGINDRHGHGIGDSVLKNAAQLIADNVGPFDIVGRGDGAVARWGGEEFILLLRNCPLQKAAELAESLRTSLASLRVAEWPDDLTVTGSFGAAEWTESTPLHMAISLADAAMYRAKKAGRNRVCAHGAEVAAPV
jgi:diguanylate cyclase (GGDEF)-like protein